MVILSFGVSYKPVLIFYACWMIWVYVFIACTCNTETVAHISMINKECDARLKLKQTVIWQWFTKCSQRPKTSTYMTMIDKKGVCTAETNACLTMINRMYHWNMLPYDYEQQIVNACIILTRALIWL
jgi:hypothetical protein